MTPLERMKRTLAEGRAAAEDVRYLITEVRQVACVSCPEDARELAAAAPQDAFRFVTQIVGTPDDAPEGAGG